MRCYYRNTSQGTRKDCGKSFLEASKRLQRLMIQLQKYKLNVMYKRHVYMYIANTLSRAYLSILNLVNEEDEEFIQNIENVEMAKDLSICPERK